MIFLLLLTIDDEDDRQLLLLLYKEYYPTMKAKAMSIVKNPTDADDIIQSATIRLIDKISSLRDLNHHQRVAYVVKTVQCTALDFIRKEKKYSQNVELENYAFDIADEVEPPVPEQYEYIEKFEKLGELLDTLPERDKSLLIMKYYLDFTDKQIAEHLGLNHGATRTALNRARKKAKIVLSKAGIWDE